MLLHKDWMIEDMPSVALVCDKLCGWTEAVSLTTQKKTFKGVPRSAPDPVELNRRCGVVQIRYSQSTLDINTKSLNINSNININTNTPQTMALTVRIK